MTDLSQFAGVWRWTPQEQNQGLLPLLKPLDFSEFDFRISLQIGENKGLFPSVILGGSQWDKKLFPDYKGYLVGFDAFEQQYVVKKEGDLVHAVAGAFPADHNKHSIEIAKKQDQILLWVDHTLVISYRDPDMKENHEGFIYLYSNFAGKGKITLDSIQLSVFSHKQRSALPVNRCVLQNGLDTTVEFTQLIDSRIARIYGLFYYVFLLHDVSFFTRNIKSLEEEKEKAFLERNKFKALAMQGGGEREEMLGVSPKLISIKENAKIAAASSVTVLIEGKTGTGKEVLAHYIHWHSLNSQGPFVKVDCSALPGSLLESELFGFEKGAFTGADHSRKGKLEEAEGGTLFLDEIGNLSANAQKKLLNFLQDFTLERVGSNKKIRVHTRIITATNEPLSELVKQGGFRSDLFYRLNIVNFQLPMLQERKEDIPYLCTHFLQIYNKRFNRSVKGFSAESFQKLIEYDWPGNIRELENAVQRAVLYCEKKTIEKEHLNFMPEKTQAAHAPLAPTFPSGNSRSLKREHLVLLLRKNNGVVKYAASEAGISRATLFRKIKKYKITKAEMF
ncbi:MAG: sigma-54 dependent transcriptional regulator [Fibrobacterota bacterium]